jgi:hypothetical protein
MLENTCTSAIFIRKSLSVRFAGNRTWRLPFRGLGAEPDAPVRLPSHPISARGAASQGMKPNLCTQMCMDVNAEVI